MQVSRTRVVLRPRTAWEAMDLGLVMLRAWWRPVLALWLPTIAVAAVLAGLAGALGLALETSGLLLGWLALWWSKPLLDRPLVLLFSRALFDDPPSARASLRWLSAMARAGALWHLSLGRLDPLRSFHLPVWQLEGLDRQRRRARFRDLDAQVRGRGILLTLICMSMELVVFASLFGFVYLLLPAPPSLGPGEMPGLLEVPWSGRLALLAYLVTVAIVEPVYVAAGFGLYLNRRTILEGWDIELDFRRLVARVDRLEAAHQPPARRGPAARPAILLALGMVAVCASWAPSAVAEPVAAQRLGPEQAQPTAAALLAEPPFTVREMKRAIAWGDRPGVPGLDWSLDLGWLGTLGAWLARVSELLVWGGLAAAVVWLLVLAARHAGRRRVHGRGIAPPAAESPLPGVTLRVPDVELPADLAGRAESLLRGNEVRAALALLYRGSVDRLVRLGIPIPQAATEREVLDRSRARLPETTVRYLERLVPAWLAAAYAHTPPPAATVAVLCQDWRACFTSSASRSRPGPGPC